VIKPRIMISGTYSVCKKMRAPHKISVGKPEGHNTLGRPRYRWMNSIKMDFKEVGFEGVCLIYVARNRIQ